MAGTACRQQPRPRRTPRLQPPRAGRRRARERDEVPGRGERKVPRGFDLAVSLCPSPGGRGSDVVSLDTALALKLSYVLIFKKLYQFLFYYELCQTQSPFLMKVI